MAHYNTCIEIFAIKKEIFSAKFQGMEFFSEYFKAIIEMESSFAWEIKEKDN